MNYFEKSVLINCPLKKVFEFHTDTNNLKKITPDFIKVDIIKIDLPLKLGSEIILELIQIHIIKTIWKIQLTDFKPYTIITDTQIKGPFKVWVHSHCFKDQHDKTLMTDKVNYELPFGILGKTVNQILIKRLINKQFEFRHKTTKEILEEKDREK
ncbi:MAG: SRPBCC family protein [Bacteroidota bacterium]|nr:SRPBCC family protein [Bacteroidota bacterium]